MKRIITQTKTMLFAMTALLLISSQLKAATYTAILSGSFSNTATWSGGIAPPISLQSGDIVIIPSGITISLDQNLSLASSTSLDVDGVLTGGTGYALILTSGTLSGTGSIDIDSISAAFTSGFNFTGNLTTNAFYSTNANINSAATIVIDNMLYLAGGTITMASGILSLNNNATIIVDGGTMSLSGGTADLTNTYHVMYKGGTSTAGLELSGTGLTNITINTNSGQEVKLSNNLTINGNLALTMGALNLNNNHLTFSANGDLAASGSGTITSLTGSDITINASGGLSGTLRFTSGGNTVNNFTLNLGSGSASVMVNSDLMISGNLNLQQGRLNMGANKLEVDANGTVTGGSANSFVITGTGGTLSLNLNTGNTKTFHIGTGNDYAPIMIKSNSSSVNTRLYIGVNTDVKANGSTGASASATQPLVNATWFVTSSATAGVDVDMTVMWSTNMEVNSFNRAKAYISHYTNGNWDANVASAATMSGSMYSMTRAGISSFSPFAVFDENATLSIDEVVANTIINLYPNPATDVINISVTGNNNDMNAEIYNVSGQVVYKAAVQNNSSINISNLPDGMYYIKLNGETANGTKKFIKQ
jgi:lipopolysaccharide export system protein LptA